MISNLTLQFIGLFLSLFWIDCDFYVEHWLIIIFTGSLSVPIIASFACDIALLVVNFNNNCNDAMILGDGRSQYVGGKLNSWIWTGCSIHVTAMLYLICSGFVQACLMDEALRK